MIKEFMEKTLRALKAQADPQSSSKKEKSLALVDFGLVCEVNLPYRQVNNVIV